MSSSEFESLLQRRRRIPVPLGEHHLDRQLFLYQKAPSDGLRTSITLTLDSLEQKLQVNPYTEPSRSSELRDGDYHIFTSSGGQELRLSFDKGHPNYTGHGLIGGISDRGKSTLMSVIASAAAPKCYTLILDVTKSFRAMSSMRKHHRTVLAEHLRINPYQGVDGVPHQVVDTEISNELADNWELKYSHYELSEATEYVRTIETPNPLKIIRELESRQRGVRNSRRYMYRDSILLVLKTIMRTTQIHACEVGMSLPDIIKENTVIEAHNLLPDLQRWFARLLFSYVRLLTLSGNKLDKPLLVFLDEGQAICTDKDFATKILQLRHHNVHLFVNFQNLAKAPIELFNSDFLAAFQCVNQLDRRAFAQSANLNRNQEDFLATLGKGECCCVHSNISQPLIGTVPSPEYIHVSDEEIFQKSMDFIGSLDWKPIEETSDLSTETSTNTQDQKTESFMHDVLNQAHEFSALTQRFERAGIRSYSQQQRILKAVEAKGYIRILSLMINKRGAPIKLVEPTQKALDEYNVQWKKTRGTLPTRAATHYLAEKFHALEKWQCIREGTLK